MQVDELEVTAGEERRLRAGLRRIEAQQSASEQCQQVSMRLGSGGLSQGLQQIEQSLRLILSDEAVYSGAEDSKLMLSGTGCR